MAAESSVKLAIEAAVEGQAKIAELAAEIDKAGGNADEFRGAAERLDAELDQLQNQQQLLAQFRELEKGLTSTAAKLDAAKQQQRSLSDAVTASLAPSQRQVAEQKNAETALAKLSALVEKAAARQKTLTDQVTAAEAPNIKLIARHTQATERLDRLSRAHEVARDRVSAATAAVAAGNVPTARLAKSHEEATDKVEALNGKLARENVLLSDLRGKLAAAGVDTTNLGNAEAGLATKTAAAQAELSKIGGSLGQQKQAIDTLRAAFERLNVKPFQDIQREAESVRAALKRLEEANRSGVISDRELAKAKAAAAQEIRNLSASTNGALKVLREAGVAVGAFGASLAGIGVGASRALTTFRDFETQIGSISTLLEETPAQLGTLADEVNRLGAEFGKAPTDEAKALYEIISAGAGDAAAATELLTAANKLAIGGVTDVKTAADGLTSVLAAYGLSADEATSVSDALFVAAAGGKTTIDELSRSLGQVAPIAAQTGVSLEELTAGVSAITKGGVKTAEAVTQLRGVITGVLQPSKEAADLAAELGLQFDAAALKSKGLAGFLEDVRQKTGGNAEQIALLFGRVEALNGVLQLTGNQSQSFAQILDQMASRAGATETAFGKVASTSGFTFGQLGAQFEVFKQRIGAVIADVLVPLARIAGDVLEALNALPAPLVAIGVALGPATTAALAFRSALGPLIGALGLLRTAAPAITLAPLATGMATATTAASTLRLALTALSRVFLGFGVGFAIGTGLNQSFEILQGLIDDTARKTEDAKRGVLLKYSAEQIAIEGTIRTLAEYRNIQIKSGEDLKLLDTAARALYAGQLDGARQIAELNFRNAQLAVISARERGLDAEKLIKAADLERAKLEEVKKAQDALTESNKVYAALLAAGITPQIQALIEKFDKARTAGESVRKSLEALGAIKDFGNPQEIENFILALTRLEKQGQITASDLREKLGQSLQGLSNEDLAKFEVAARAAFDGVNKKSFELAAAIDALREEQFKRLGIDVSTVLTGIDDKAADLLETFKLLVSDPKADPRLLKAAFDELLKTLDSPEELRSFRQAIIDSGNAALDTAQNIGEIDKKLKEVAATADPELRKIEEAFKRLGITSNAELEKQKQQADADYALISGSGVRSAQTIGTAQTAAHAQRLREGQTLTDADLGHDTQRTSSARISQTQIDEAFAKTVEAHLKAAAAQGDSALKAEFAAQRARASTQAQEKAVEDSAKAYEKQGGAATDAGDKAKKAAEESAAAVKDFQERIAGAETKAGFDALRKEIKSAFDDGTLSAEQYKQVLAGLDAKVNETSSFFREFQQKLAGAETLEDIRELRRTINEAFQQGKLSAEEYSAALDGIKSKTKELAEATRVVRGQIQGVDELGEKASAAFAAASRGIVAGAKAASSKIGQLEDIVASYRRQQDLLNDALQRVGVVGTEAFGRVGISAGRTLRNAESVRLQIQLLDDADLDRLTSAIDGARQRLQSLREASREALAALTDDLDRLRGNEEAIEKRREQARRRELQAQLAFARATGDAESVTNLERALAVLGQIELEQRKARDAARIERAAEEKARELELRDAQRAEQAAKGKRADEISAAAPERERGVPQPRRSEREIDPVFDPPPPRSPPPAAPASQARTIRVEFVIANTRAVGTFDEDSAEDFLDALERAKRVSVN